MKEEIFVREHVLDMIMHFNIAKVNGGAIDEANQNLTMGKGKQAKANVSTSKRKFLRGFSFKIKVGPSKPNAQIKKKGRGKTPKQNKGKKSAEKGKCYHCGQNGHWLRNCSKYLAEKETQGYPKELRGGIFYDPQENKVIVSTNATLLEEDHIRDHQPCSKLVSNKISKNTTNKPSSSTKVVDKTRKSGQSHPSQELKEPRRSGRVVHQPNLYLGLTETQVVIHDDGVKDPLTYKQAMNDVDHDQWNKAMNLEMKSMYFNSIWTLIDQPNDIRPIGCKWIYKRKQDQVGKVQTFKAQLVAKGYTQREGVDYKETFSFVAMLKSIRILLSIVTFYDYEIWLMDVKTAFVNGNLEESIYMAQPKGFIEQNQEQKVCKLQKSIYGLKQACRSWIIRLDTAIKSYGFEKNVDAPCVYKKIINSVVTFLVLYVDDILLIGNDVGYLNDIKKWPAIQFKCKI
ncbi:gag/pol protein [Cucumis melo var. makuwa]|uniref:Gag/pol protein n=1 Tax=Cucumis melo var. makuwa TaxID=1194695 RepID=A0A5D3DVP2_CUCMM|nr:gag/pol protein [Cucumis melo var. makuwa]TYK27350.1 gag/pol protein [Cucumis melo var. makuwa]